MDIFQWYQEKKESSKAMADQTDKADKISLARLIRAGQSVIALGQGGVIAVEMVILSCLLVPTLGLFIDGARIIHSKSILDRAAQVCADSGAANLGYWDKDQAGLPIFIVDQAGANQAATIAVGLVKVDGQDPILEGITIDEDAKSVTVSLKHDFEPILPVPLNIGLKSQAVQVRVN